MQHSPAIKGLATVRRAYRRNVSERRLEYQFWLTLLLIGLGFALIVIRPETFDRVTLAAAVVVAYWFGKGTADNGAGETHHE